MKILIIGGTGFIGNSLTEKLLEINSEVYVISRTEDSLKTRDNLHYFTCSLNQLEKLKLIIEGNRIELIIHLASTLVPSSNFNSFIKEFEEIITPTNHLIHYLGDKSIPLIFFSSGGTIYGNSNLLPTPEPANSNPICYYGISKFLIERIILNEAKENGLKYLIIRPSNPYGVGQQKNKNQGIIPRIFDALLKNSNFEIWGKDTIRDYIEVSDLATIIVKIISQKVYNQTLNVSTGVGTSISELINIIQKITESQLNYNIIPVEHETIEVSIPSNHNLKTIIPDLKLKSIEEGLREYYHNYIE